MADDEKIIRIEAKFTEDKKASEPPSSAGATREVESASTESARDRLEYERLERDRQHTEKYKQLESDIYNKEEEPLSDIPEPAPSSTEASPESPAGATPPSAASPSNEEGEPSSPGGSQLPPVPPSLSAPSGSGSAAAGSYMGAVAGTAFNTAGAVLGGGATAVGNALLGLATGPIGVAGLAFAGLASAAAGLTGLFLSAFDMLEKQFEEFSATLQVARAEQDIELTLQKIKSGDKAAGSGMPFDESSALISEETDFYKNLIALAEKAINIFGPTLELLAEVTNGILDVANGGLEVLKYLALIINGPIKLITESLKLFRKLAEFFLGQDVKEDDKMQADAVKLFSGLTNHGPKLTNKSFPAPHANQPDF